VRDAIDFHAHYRYTGERCHVSARYVCHRLRRFFAIAAFFAAVTPTASPSPLYFHAMLSLFFFRHDVATPGAKKDNNRPNYEHAIKIVAAADACLFQDAMPRYDAAAVTPARDYAAAAAAADIFVANMMREWREAR